ncbi:uncharacterized protein JCM10292_001182 [Rhodotorula paludigena]|uniref:uncharacterized protein n=1 Tax=Rhodotorula paludigena TaxID=86838 RepID=UPI0031771AF1
MASEIEARVLVLYTGGTIGMLKSEGGGYAPHPGFLASNLRSQARFYDPAGESVFANSESVGAFKSWSASRSRSGASTPTPPHLPPEQDPTALRVETSDGHIYVHSLVTPRFAQGKRVRYAVWEYENLIDSSEIEPSDWIRIASDIERNYHAFDGFLILHGTDTLAFTASALSFLLEDLGKTVILTGAQIPLSQLFTDAVDNLLASLAIAGHYLIPEVLLVFDNMAFRGNRCIKASSEDFHAFQSFNLPPIAEVGIDIEVAWSQVLRPGPRPFRVHKKLCADVATLRIFPGITGAAVRAFLSASGGIRGAVIETYGAGNAPRREELLSAFREASERGVVLVNITQCPTGAVASDIYATGRALAAAGIVSGADMTTECALAKLSYLLSKPELSPDQVRKLLSQPLRGELTPSAPVPTYSSPHDVDTRLRALFSQLIECAPPQQRAAAHKAVRPQVTAGDPVLPPEYSATWPATLADEEALKAAVMPYLLSQAASQSTDLLRTLVASLDTPALPPVTSQLTSTSSSTLALPSLLNEAAQTTLQTPLHLAVLAGNSPNVDLLLSSGASVHVRDAHGHSPLFYAVRHGATSVDEARKMVVSLKAAGAHLGELELETGAVGLEVCKAGKAAEPAIRDLWVEAAGEEGVKRAKAALAALVGVS